MLYRKIIDRLYIYSVYMWYICNWIGSSLDRRPEHAQPLFWAGYPRPPPVEGAQDDLRDAAGVLDDPRIQNSVHLT